MRTALALLFVLPNVTGLWLCCCTFGATPNRTEIATAPQSPKPSEDRCEHCCHTANDGSSTPASVSPVPKTCPCQQFMISLLDSAPAIPEPATSPEQGNVPAAFAFNRTDDLPSTVTGPASAGEYAFHPPDHRQRYHHVLRC